MTRESWFSLLLAENCQCKIETVERSSNPTRGAVLPFSEPEQIQNHSNLGLLKCSGEAGLEPKEKLIELRKGCWQVHRFGRDRKEGGE